MASQLRITEKLEEIYSRIPSSNCIHCHECCGPVLWFEPEELLIKKYLSNNNIKRIVWTKEEFENNNMRCPYLREDQCSIYPVRPLVCRLQGAAPDLLCKKKTNQKNMDSLELKKMLDDFKKLIIETKRINVFYCTKKLDLYGEI